MIKAILRWTGYLFLCIFGLAAGLYLGDTIVFYLRSKPQSQVVISQQLAAPLKNNKTDYYYEGTGPSPCSLSLFPQGGMTPCWYLRRHPVVTDTL